jgi:NAD+ diphosphatase
VPEVRVLACRAQRRRELAAHPALGEHRLRRPLQPLAHGGTRGALPHGVDDLGRECVAQHRQAQAAAGGLGVGVVGGQRGGHGVDGRQPAGAGGCRHGGGQLLRLRDLGHHGGCIVEALRMNFIPAIDLVGEPTPQGWHLAFVDGKLLLLAEAEAPQLQPLSGLAAAALRMDAQARHYLGRLDGLDCWALRLPEVPAGWQPVPLRQAMMAFPETLAGAGRPRGAGAGMGPHAPLLRRLRHAHRAPGRRTRAPLPGLRPHGLPAHQPGHDGAGVAPGRGAAGARAALRQGHVQRAGRLRRGRRIHRALHPPRGGRRGGRARDDLRYYGSQSWPFPNSLMIAFSARWDGGDIVPQPGEIADAQWFDLDALPNIPPRFSISGHLIRDTVAALRGQT